jgi:hypothetical protein
VSSPLVVLTTTALGPLTLSLPEMILTYRQRTYQLVVTARHKVELRAYEPADGNGHLDIGPSPAP